jgi:hypothetical protein
MKNEHFHTLALSDLLVDIPFHSILCFPFLSLPSFSLTILLTFSHTRHSSLCRAHSFQKVMRTCLFLSSAIALVALAATATADAKNPSTTNVSSYTVPNDENNSHGYFTLIDRETQLDGSRVCSILDRGETQVYRNLWPANRSGDRFQVLRRNVHDESHGHHGRSQSNEETFDIAKEVNDLFEINTNSKDWEFMEGAFLEDECDQVKDETLSNSAIVDGVQGSNGGSGSSQLVFGDDDAAPGLQEGDEVVRNEQNLWDFFFHTKQLTMSNPMHEKI